MERTVTVNETHGRGRMREIGVFAIGLIALTALMLFLSDGTVLLTRPFWVDEWLTVFIANRSSPVQLFGDLATGADGGASLVHVVHWLVRLVAGELTPVIVRCLSLASVLGALVVVFAILRRRFSAGASTAGALAVGAAELVVAHSYEGRFYGPWLLAAALTAWFFGRRQDARAAGDEKSVRRAGIGLAISAFVLVITHSYGVVSLVMLAAGALLSYGPRWRNGLRDVAPAAAGFLALAIVIPLALGQKAAYTVPTWLPDFAMVQLWDLSDRFWRAPMVLIAGLVLVVAVALALARGNRPRVRQVTANATSDAACVSLFALALVPVALMALSLLGQPSMLSRYAILTPLAWAPWVAVAAELGGRWAARGLALAAAWYWFVGYVRESSARTMFAVAVQQAQHTYAQARTTGLPIVLYSLHHMYPLIGREPRQAPGVFVDIPDSVFTALFPPNTGLAQINRGVILERDLARVHAARWGFPRLVTLAALDTTSRFVLLGPLGRLPAGFRDIEQFAKAMFPHHQLKRLMPDLTLLERAGSRPSSK